MVRIVLLILIMISLLGCNSTEVSDKIETLEKNVDQVSNSSEEWNDETHGASVTPNYDVVFPQDKVNRIDITISADDWQGIMENMTDLYGDFGVAERNQPNQNNPGANNNQPPGGMQQNEGGITSSEVNPDFFEADIIFNNETWENVGFRFKGNSTIRRSWQNGILKMSIKLDFDQFEEEYPEIEDQRFYGFKQLSLGSNAFDDSLLREKVTADIFRDAGLVSAQTAYYAVYIDHGEGAKYFGLYTMVEVIDDTVIKTQSNDDSGNLYKPEGKGANFALGSFNETTFEKETNEENADWSDIQALFDALHDDNRTNNPEIWRANLESVFDVDTFIHWLAVNSVIQNWDTYGSIAHNYYLYNDPVTDTLVWIPWDNNEALQNGKGNRQISSLLDLSGVNDNWPLISYLMADDVYFQVYRSYVQDTITNVFTSEKMSYTFQYYHELIQTYVTGTNAEKEGFTHLKSADAFNQSVKELTQYVNERIKIASTFLNTAK